MSLEKSQGFKVNIPEEEIEFNNIKKLSEYKVLKKKYDLKISTRLENEDKTLSISKNQDKAFFVSPSDDFLIDVKELNDELAKYDQMVLDAYFYNFYSYKEDIEEGFDKLFKNLNITPSSDFSVKRQSFFMEDIPGFKEIEMSKTEGKEWRFKFKSKKPTDPDVTSALKSASFEKLEDAIIFLNKIIEYKAKNPTL